MPEFFTSEGHLDGRTVWLHVGKRLFGPKWPEVRRHLLACPHCAHVMQHLAGLGPPPEAQSPDSVVIDFGEVHPDLMGHPDPPTAEFEPSMRFAPAAEPARPAEALFEPEPSRVLPRVAPATPVPARRAPAQPALSRAATPRPRPMPPPAAMNIMATADAIAALPDLRPTEMDLLAHHRRRGGGQFWLIASAVAAALLVATVTILLLEKGRDREPEAAPGPVKIVIDTRAPTPR